MNFASGLPSFTMKLVPDPIQVMPRIIYIDERGSKKSYSSKSYKKKRYRKKTTPATAPAAPAAAPVTPPRTAPADMEVDEEPIPAGDINRIRRRAERRDRRRIRSVRRRILQ